MASGAVAGGEGVRRDRPASAPDVAQGPRTPMRPPRRAYDAGTTPGGRRGRERAASPLQDSPQAKRIRARPAPDQPGPAEGASPARRIAEVRAQQLRDGEWFDELQAVVEDHAEIIDQHSHDRMRMHMNISELQEEAMTSRGRMVEFENRVMNKKRSTFEGQGLANKNLI